MADEIDYLFLKSLIKDSKSLKLLDFVEGNRRLIFDEKKVIKDNRLIKLKILGFNIWLRRGSCAPELMTFQEIFKEHTHTKHEAFNGEGNKIILDIGANEGYYTLFMKKYNPNANIIALEPIPKTYNILKKNVLGNKIKNVKLLKKALTDKTGKTVFEFVPEVSAISSTNMGLQDRPWLEKSRIKTINVDSVTLKELFQKFKLDYVDILKLDVEGSELKILENSKDILNKIKKIVIEYHSDELKEKCKNLLINKGFKLVLEDKTSPCGDIYFLA